MTTNMTINLRAVYTVSFRKSEMTNYKEFAKKNPKLAAKLGGNDAVLLISQSGDQLCFVHGFKTSRDGSSIARVLRSERLRLEAGTWSPFMLANYAASVGIKLVGHKRFEEHFAIYGETRRTARILAAA
jgi:hypothetical protein